MLPNEIAGYWVPAQIAILVLKSTKQSSYFWSATGVRTIVMFFTQCCVLSVDKLPVVDNFSYQVTSIQFIVAWNIDSYT